MKQALIYSLKVWVTTSVLAPLFVTLLRFIMDGKLVTSHFSHHKSNGLLDSLWFRLLGLIEVDTIMLIPLGVGLYYTIRYLVKRNTRFHLCKRYLSIVGGLLAILPMAILLCYMMAETGSNHQMLYLRLITIFCVANGSIALASIWFYKLKPIDHNPLNETTV